MIRSDRGPIGAIGGAGIGLALNGLRRGGFGGLAQTTAGGAMLGFNLGGPLGAAIGAGVGAIAGTIRLFVQGAQEKAREKIKQLYGVDISDSSFLKQIVDMAKQAYGGNLDVALRSKDIRDLILLYAQSTGQNAKGMPAQMSALSMVQSGRIVVPVSGLPERHADGQPRRLAHARFGWKGSAVRRRAGGEHQRAGREGILREGNGERNSRQSACGPVGDV